MREYIIFKNVGLLALPINMSEDEFYNLMQNIWIWYNHYSDDSDDEDSDDEDSDDEDSDDEDS